MPDRTDQRKPAAEVAKRTLSLTVAGKVLYAVAFAFGVVALYGVLAVWYFRQSSGWPWLLAGACGFVVTVIAFQLLRKKLVA